MSDDRSPSERRRRRLVPGRGRGRCIVRFDDRLALRIARGRARQCVNGRPPARRAPRPRREPHPTVVVRRGCVPPTAPAP